MSTAAEARRKGYIVLAKGGRTYALLDHLGLNKRNYFLRLDWREVCLREHLPLVTVAVKGEWAAVDCDLEPVGEGYCEATFTDAQRERISTMIHDAAVRTLKGDMKVKGGISHSAGRHGAYVDKLPHDEAEKVAAALVAEGCKAPLHDVWQELTS
jgi:hypothetical protein